MSSDDENMRRLPIRPSNVEPLTARVLNRLAEHPAEARSMILGGGFAMNHYLAPRMTFDVDTWWTKDSTNDDRKAALEVLREILPEVADEFGMAFSERANASHEMISLELRDAERTFSYQIAPHTIELDSPFVDESPWAPIPIETLRDNVASKVNALVARGAPRDFSDIHRVIDDGVMSVEEVWDLWSKKNPDQDVELAKAQVVKRIESIELRRPLERLPEEHREQVASDRGWVRNVLAVPLALDMEREPAPDPPAPDLADNDGFER